METNFSAKRAEAIGHPLAKTKQNKNKLWPNSPPYTKIRAIDLDANGPQIVIIDWIYDYPGMQLLG